MCFLKPKKKGTKSCVEHLFVWKLGLVDKRNPHRLQFFSVFSSLACFAWKLPSIQTHTRLGDSGPRAPEPPTPVDFAPTPLPILRLRQGRTPPSTKVPPSLLSRNCFRPWQARPWINQLKLDVAMLKGELALFSRSLLNFLPVFRHTGCVLRCAPHRNAAHAVSERNACARTTQRGTYLVSTLPGNLAILDCRVFEGREGTVLHALPNHAHSTQHLLGRLRTTHRKTHLVSTQLNSRNPAVRRSCVRGREETIDIHRRRENRVQRASGASFPPRDKRRVPVSFIVLKGAFVSSGMKTIDFCSAIWIHKTTFFSL